MSVAFIVSTPCFVLFFNTIILSTSCCCCFFVNSGCSMRTQTCACVCKTCTFGLHKDTPSHSLNLMHALWTHLHPDTLKPKIEGGFSSIALLPTTSIHQWPVQDHPAPSPHACLYGPGFGPHGFLVKWWLINLTWSDKKKKKNLNPAPELMGNQCQCALLKKTDLKCL